MLSVSCARSFASSLAGPHDAMSGVDGATPDLADLFWVGVRACFCAYGV